jgi:hypothetical protein
MNWKTRVPRLRTFLLIMLGLFLFLMLLLHYQARRERALSKSTGLGAVAGGWDPISQWSGSSFIGPRKGRQAKGVVGGVPGGLDRDRLISASLKSSEPVEEASRSDLPDKKMIQSVGLQLLVKNASDAAVQVERIVMALDGEIEKSDLRNDGNSRQGEIILRVPADRLNDAVAQFSKLAIRMENQHRESHDITREFLDNEARLRNMKLEEEQYLVLLRRAGSMKDTLQITEKVSEVRGEIEALQGELNWQSHQVAMSVVQVQLIEEPQASVATRWRPIYNAKNSASAMLAGLGEWVDWVVAFVIDLPLVLVWTASIGGLLVFAWKLLRWVWLRFLKPTPFIASV